MTTSPVQRTAAPTTGPERAMLEGWLEHHRATLRQKCEGLDEDGMRARAISPSGLSLLGLVRHLTDVERHWFRRILAAEATEPLYYSDGAPDGDFRPCPTQSAAEAWAAWDAEVCAARAGAAARELDDLAAGTGRDGTAYTLRWIYLHMIEEYARHNGHADLLREAVDGTTGV